MIDKERKEIWKLIQVSLICKDKSIENKIKKEFLKNFTVDVTQTPKYLINLLNDAYNEKNPDDVEILLYVAGCFNLFSIEFLYILIKLIESEWHFKHEDIVSVFQMLKSPLTIDCLYNTALKQFKYLEYDDFFALAVKCIWALGEIKTKKAIEKLNLLAQSDNEIIRENAVRQLKRK